MSLGSRTIEGDDFGALLRRIRIAARLTQEEVATTAGLSVRSIREIERGNVRHPRPDSVRRLAQAFGLDAAQQTRFERIARAGYWRDRSGDGAGVENERCLVCAAPAQMPEQPPTVINDQTHRVEDPPALDTVFAGPVTVLVIACTGNTMPARRYGTPPPLRLHGHDG